MTTQIMTLTQERIGDNNALQTFIDRAKQLTIPLFPETVQFTDPALKFGAALVSVNTQLDSYGNNRDIYKNESGGYCLHLSKINEIGQQAGLQIIDSRILERKVDDQGRVTYISHQVKWRLKSIDGSIKEGVATGKYDYYNDVATKKPGQVNSRRKHAEALAESNALTRAYNKAIAKLPQSFTLQELSKPFLVPYVLEDRDALISQLPAEDQMAIKKELVRKRLGIAETIYGAPGNKVEEIPATVVPDDEVHSVSSTQPEQESGMSKAERNKITANEYRDSPQEIRTSKILQLVMEKGYRDSGGNAVTAKRLEANSVDAQIAFLEKLLNIEAGL